MRKVISTNLATLRQFKQFSQFYQQQKEEIKPEPEVGAKCELLNNHPEVWWKVVQKCASPSKKELILIIVINNPRAPEDFCTKEIY